MAPHTMMIGPLAATAVSAAAVDGDNKLFAVDNVVRIVVVNVAAFAGGERHPTVAQLHCPWHSADGVLDNAPMMRMQMMVVAPFVVGVVVASLLQYAAVLLLCQLLLPAFHRRPCSKRNCWYLSLQRCSAVCRLRMLPLVVVVLLAVLAHHRPYSLSYVYCSCCCVVNRCHRHCVCCWCDCYCSGCCCCCRCYDQHYHHHCSYCYFQQLHCQPSLWLQH